MIKFGQTMPGLTISTGKHKIKKHYFSPNQPGEFFMIIRLLNDHPTPLSVRTNSFYDFFILQGNKGTFYRSFCYTYPGSQFISSIFSIFYQQRNNFLFCFIQKNMIADIITDMITDIVVFLLVQNFFIKWNRATDVVIFYFKNGFAILFHNSWDPMSGMFR